MQLPSGNSHKVITFFMSVMITILLLTLSALIIAVGFALGYAAVLWAIGGNCG